MYVPLPLPYRRKTQLLMLSMTYPSRCPLYPRVASHHTSSFITELLARILMERRRSGARTSLRTVLLGHSGNSALRRQGTEAYFCRVTTLQFYAISLNWRQSSATTTQSSLRYSCLFLAASIITMTFLTASTVERLLLNSNCSSFRSPPSSRCFSRRFFIVLQIFCLRCLIGILACTKKGIPLVFFLLQIRCAPVDVTVSAVALPIEGAMLDPPPPTGIWLADNETWDEPLPAAGSVVTKASVTVKLYIPRE